MVYMGIHFCILETPHDLKKEKERMRERKKISALLGFGDKNLSILSVQPDIHCIFFYFVTFDI